MADFISDFGSGLRDNVLPTGDVLNRKIDSQREKFLKGISSTKHGKKEDPTYLHFKFIFDLGNTSLIDQETFLAPSPLFRPFKPTATDLSAEANEIGNFRASQKNSIDPTKQGTPDQIAKIDQLASVGDSGFKSDMDFFYGSKFKIDERYHHGAFNINGGGVAYMGAQEFLAQRSLKRQQMLDAFRNGLNFINTECPYYFQSVSGLDQLLKTDIKNFHKPAGKPMRAGTLNIECMESIDMRIFSLSELYRKAVYDYTYHRIMLPENLRKFRMWMVVTEVRNIQLSYGINDILNPFSIPSVAQAANFLDSFNSQTGLLNNTQGLLQKSTNTDSPYNDKFGSYTMGPYAFVYQFDQCEFDFDDSFPSYSSIDNKGGQAVTNKFKIHVGRVKDYKIQFNQLSDVIKKNDNIQQMVLSDVWGSATNDYNNYDYVGSTGISSVDLSSTANPGQAFAQMASNFINNTVADLKNQGVAILEGALLGNIYGLGGLNAGAATRNVQSLVNTLKNGIPNPFDDNTPQGQGLGGPGERQYPTLNEDVYTGSSTGVNGSLGNTLTNPPASSNSLNEDSYPNNPGADLGVPDRQYPTVSTDEYINNPGSDLGVPGRVYPTIDLDVYQNNPGTDLGVPDRQYPVISDDAYGNVPGADLGVPSRVYPDLNLDVYPTNPGSDLGVPDRVYPSNSDDEFKNVPGSDLGVIGRVYEEPGGDVYANNPGSDLGLPTREYKKAEGDEYKNVPGSDLGGIGRIYENVKEDLYSKVPGSDLGGNERNYPNVKGREYTESRPPLENNLGRIYPTTNGNENS
jgi:hypothetical protein